MTERRFWVETKLAGETPGAKVFLSSAQQRHASKVLRLVDGGDVMLFDGQGGMARGVMNGPAATLTEITQHPKPTPEIVLLQALCKPQTADNVVRFATELGVSKVVFFVSARSSQFSIWEKRAERFLRITRESSRQCERLYLPELNCVRSLEDAIATLPVEGERIAGAARLAESAPSDFSSFSSAHRSLAIGPEGGFEDQELDAMETAGFQFIRLAAQVLRVDTAVAAALARVQ